MESRFHVSDGLFFSRLENGDVRILKTKEGKVCSFCAGTGGKLTPAGIPIDGGGDCGVCHGTGLDETVLDITVDKNGWQSVIASVSAGGEDGYRFYLAGIFHNSPKNKFLDDVKQWAETYQI